MVHISEFSPYDSFIYLNQLRSLFLNIEVAWKLLQY